MGFGDPVMIRVPDLKQITKLELRWTAGIWQGKTIDSDEHIAGTASGIRTGRSARPMAVALVAPELYTTGDVAAFRQEGGRGDGATPDGRPGAPARAGDTGSA